MKTRAAHMMVILGALLSLVIAGSNGAASADTPVVEIHIDTKQTRPLAKTLHGFNTNLISGEYGYADDEFERQTRALKPALLRFPGGTVANYYRWQKQGYTKEDLASTGAKEYRERNLRNLALLQQRREGKLSFDDFMHLCKKIGARPVVVVNLFTAEPAESAAWVRYAKAKGYDVVGWELGNELYLPRYRKRLPSVDAYIQVAKRHAAAMRAADPQIRLVVPAHPAGFHLASSSRYARRWNMVLAEASFYDAYAVHPYLKIHEHFEPDYGADLDVISADLFGLSTTSFAQAKDYYRNLFGDREMWVTEWNLREKHGRDIVDTLLHGLYVADFAVQLLAFDANVPVAAYHVLAGRWNGFPTFTPSQLINGKATDSIRRASFPVFELLGDLYAQANHRYTLRLKQPPTLTGSRFDEDDSPPALTSAAVGNKDDIFVPVINRGGNDVLVKLFVNGHLAQHGLEYRYLASKSLADRGKEGLPIREKKVEEAILALPAHSFGVIKLR